LIREIRVIIAYSENSMNTIYIMHLFLNIKANKPEGMRPLGRPRLRLEDNIKMDLQEVGEGGGDWMERAQVRGRWRALVSTVMNFWVP
jgi:hypothetical protein